MPPTDERSFSPIATLRALCRMVGFLFIVGMGWIDYAFRVAGAGPEHRRRQQAAWLHRWSPRILRLLSVSLEVHGVPPESGLVVSNHLSYLDIYVLSSVMRCSFVAKSEIAEWPVFGTCARFCGTVFVDRARRGAVAGVAEQMREVLADDVTMVLFPEGTSSEGQDVLPFKPALFAPIVELNRPVTAMAIDYELPGGAASTEVCWGAGPIAPHAFNLLSKRMIRARVFIGAPQPPGADRKALARELHAAVVALRPTAVAASVFSSPPKDAEAPRCDAAGSVKNI
jgi:1-acyl-sn-glycerol-3-phosphate acyltransferase